MSQTTHDASFRLARTLWIALILTVAATSAFTTNESVAATDPTLADSYFQKGHKALSQSQYEVAAAAFREALEKGIDSTLAADARYWLAFSLARRGGTADLRAASEQLERLLHTYQHKAANLDDAAELLTHVQAELARMGDAEAAAHIAARAAELSREEAEIARFRAFEEAEIAQHEAQMAQVEAHIAYEEARILHEGAPLPGEWLPYEVLVLPETSEPIVALRPFAPEGEQDDVRLIALQALADMDEDRALPILKNVLARRDEGSAKLREKAAMMLAFHRSPESEKLLIDLAANDPSELVRGRALYYLGESKSGDALKIIQKTLFESTNKLLREQALKALLIQDISKTSHLFRDVASRSDMPVDFREKAIRMLGFEGSKDELPFLRRLYDQVEEESLKEAIVMSVGHKKDRESRDWLLRIIADSSNPPSAREKAFFWLGEDKSVTTSRLVELYDGLVGGEAKKQAVHVIGQRDDDQAFEFILRVARTETSPLPRRAAIFWLGQSRDPRAIECLEEIIRQ